MMKMKYRPDRINKNKYILGVFGVTIVMFFYIFWPSIGLLLEGSISKTATKIWFVTDVVSGQIFEFATFLKSKKLLDDRNKKLELDMENLNDRLLFLDVLQEENEELRTLFKTEISSTTENSKFRPQNAVLATVLAGPNLSIYDSLIIDVGSDNGIEKGSLVLSQSDIVIGVIDQVYRNSSKVRLLSYYNYQTYAYLAKTKINVSLIGLGGGNFRIDIPRDVSVIVDDIALLPSKRSQVVSTVKYIEETPTDRFKKVFLLSPVNMKTLRWVMVENI